jgi:hypothetical protein
VQVPASWSNVEERHVALPHGVEVLAGTQSGLEPVQEALQGAVPLQDLPVRGDVVLVHLPCVAAHDVHVPVHALSQQYPSTQWAEHSTSPEQESPWFFNVAHVEPAQYLPVPQDIPTQLPEQSLPSAVHRLLSHVVFVWAEQTRLAWLYPFVAKSRPGAANPSALPRYCSRPDALLSRLKIDTARRRCCRCLPESKRPLAGFFFSKALARIKRQMGETGGGN